MAVNFGCKKWYRLRPKAKQRYTFYLFVNHFAKYFCKLFLHGHKKAPPVGRAE
jgi:hypothetical protein